MKQEVDFRDMVNGDACRNERLVIFREEDEGVVE